MRIAMVFDGLQTGGIERVGADYAALFQDLGYEITVINLQPQKKDMEAEFPKNTEIIHIRYDRLFAPEQYAQLIKRNSLGRWAYPLIFGVLSLANIGYKGILKAVHPVCRKDFDLVIAFSSHFNDLTFVSMNYCRSKKKMAWVHGALYGYLLISDGFANLYNKIKNLVVLVEDAQKEVFITNKQLDLNIFKVYNPVNIGNKEIDIEKVRQLKKEHGRFMLMVARFHYPWKDHYTVINALRILKEQYGDDINVVFAGDGPEKAKVEEYVKTMPETVQHSIYFAGNVSDAQNYYKAAELYVQAGAATEGLPTTMIEAFNFDIPEIVTDVKVGPREILGDNEYGLLCTPEDPADLARKIHELLVDEKLYAHYVEMGRKRSQDFAPNTIRDRISKVINLVMEGK